VLDNVLLPAQLAGLGRAEARQRAESLLASLGVDAYAKHYPGRLSGGERQRVAVARALINRPPLLLADEPTGALDTASREDVKELIRDLNAQGQTIVLVTHDEELARTSATREIRLLDGRVVSDRALTAVAR
jgi:putative ABC transport system ATP-binding protein